MLGKLMKYEFKATARWFIPIYAALILFALISRVLLHNDPFVLKEASSFCKLLFSCQCSYMCFYLSG